MMKKRTPKEKDKTLSKSKSKALKRGPVQDLELQARAVSIKGGNRKYIPPDPC